MMRVEDRKVPVPRIRASGGGDDVDKIPIPRSQIWKEFRLRALPVVVFLAIGVVTFQLWSEKVTYSNMTGVVVGSIAEIRSPASGYLTQLEVERFQEVRAGDVIGQVITTDPRLLEARLAVVLAEVELLRHGVGPAATHQRVLLDQDALEMDIMRQRVALAAAGLRRQQAERELQRLEVLHERGLVAQAEYERGVADLAVLEMEIEQTTALIDEMSRRLADMASTRGPGPATGPIAAAIRHQEEALRLIEAEAMPAMLTSPMDGMVTRLFRSNQERVGADEPILVIRSPRPEYIVAYLPQPLRMQPEVGMPVTIRARANVRREFSGRVVRVGSQVETMEEVEALAALPSGRTGLPVMVALGEDPPAIRPGEVVQLTLRSNTRDQRP